MIVRSLLSIFLPLALVGPAGAQGVCHQENGGPDFQDFVFIGPGSMQALKLVPGFTFVASGMQVFSGESTGAATVAIWSHDAAADQPGSVITSAPFALSLPVTWAGGSFATPVTLQAGTTYWVSWALPSPSQSPIDLSKQSLGQFYRTSLNNGQTWLGPFQLNNGHFKYRLLGPCGPCSGFTVAYGQGCAGVTGLPILSAGGCPAPSHTVWLRVENGAPFAAGLLTLGSGTGSAAVVPGCLLQNLPLLPATLPLTLDGTGGRTLVATLPASTPAALATLQVLLADPAAAAGVAATEPLRMEIAP